MKNAQSTISQTNSINNIFDLIMYNVYVYTVRQFIEYKKAALKYLYALNDLLVINILLAYYKKVNNSFKISYWKDANKTKSFKLKTSACLSWVLQYRRIMPNANSEMTNSDLKTTGKSDFIDNDYQEL